MPTSRTPKLRSRSSHRRSSSHVSPERRPRRRTHSHSPVRRHARSPTCRHNRGRSPFRHVSRNRVSRDTSTLATCSTTSAYSSSGHAHRRHRDIEESSVTRLLVDRGSSEDEENRENRRRVIERRNTYVDVDEENLKEDETFHDKICRAAKVISGVLIAMGLILVFYVIITTILGESTPLDIFDFEYGKKDIINHRHDVGYQDIDTELPNFTFDTKELESADLVTDEPEVGTGEILSRKDYNEFYIENEEGDIAKNPPVYGDVDESSILSLGNETTDKDAEGRSYIAYIPVPLNEEEEEEEDEYGDEEKHDKEDKNPVDTKPFFIPVMIMPGSSMNANGAMIQNRIPQPNLGPHRPLPSFPPPRQSNRGVHRIPRPPVSSVPVPPIGSIAGMATNIPKGLTNPHLSLVDQNNIRNRLIVSHPPVSPVQSSNIPGTINIPNGQHNSQSGSINNAINFQRHENSRTDFMNHNNNNQNQGNMNRFPVNNGNTNFDNGFTTGPRNKIPIGVNSLNTLNNGDFQNGNYGLINNVHRNRNAFRPNSGNNHSSRRISSGNSLNFPLSGNPTNGPNRVSMHNNAGISSGKDSSNNEIWSSLFEILKRRSGTSPPFSGLESTGRMNSGSIPSHLGHHSHLESTPNSPPPRSDMRLRPRLLPKSRMSGPLPRPFPRYRYRLPPIPPPPGMPIVPRRPPHRSSIKPPKEFQYPKDSTSIQDIIKFMRDREKKQQNDNTGTEMQVTFGPSGEITIGDQNHIIGANPFGDTLNEYTSSSGSMEIVFGNDPVSGNNVHGAGNQGNVHFTFGGGGAPEYSSSEGNNYNSGGSNFRDGNNNNYGYNPSSNGNNNNIHNNNPSQGTGSYKNGGNNFKFGNNYGNGGNNYNNGGNNFSNFGNQHSNNGGNYNNGGNNYNSDGNNHNDSGNNYGEVNNNPGSNIRNPSSGKSRPFNIMLDVYPMDSSPSSSGSRPFQTSISFDNNNSNGAGQNQYGNHGSSNAKYNTRYHNDGRDQYSISNSKEDDANKHEIILHLNLFSKTPSKLRGNGRNEGNGDFSGRAGAVSLEIPLTGQLSPLDIYKALMDRARSQKPQAQTQHRPGLNEQSSHGARDDVEIELFDVEEGPRLLEAIERGLRSLNKDLPPDKRFLIVEESPANIDLYKAVNGEAMVTQFSAEEFLANHNHNLTYSHPNYGNTDEYFYYDYYDYQDEGIDSDKTTPPSSMNTTFTYYNHDHYEQLPTPCSHKGHADEK